MTDIKFKCPLCGQSLSADESQSGSVVECPTCKEKISIPKTPVTTDAQTAQQPNISESSPETKKCPFCGEQIRPEAIRCRFCGGSLRKNGVGEFDQQGLRKVLSMLRKATDIEPLLKAMNRGVVIRKTIGIVVQIESIILGLGFLYLWILTWRILNEISFWGGISIIIWQLSFPYAAFLITKLFFCEVQI